MTKTSSTVTIVDKNLSCRIYQREFLSSMGMRTRDDQGCNVGGTGGAALLEYCYFIIIKFSGVALLSYSIQLRLMGLHLHRRRTTLVGSIFSLYYS